VNSPILVTGGAGFVGSHLVARLLESGARVRCLVRRSSSLGRLPGGQVELAYGDLAAGDGIRQALDGVDTVFHVAGTTKALSSAEYYRGNLEATRKLLRACEERGAPLPRLIHVSSLAAAGPSPDARGLSEDAEPRPLSHYGKSKLAAECAVRDSALGSSAVIVRPPVVYGPGDTDVLEVFRSVSRGLMLRIGRGESLFSFIYASDLAEALLAAALCPGAAGETFFAASAEPVSWLQFGAQAAAAMNRRFRTIAAPAALAFAAAWGAEIVSKWRGTPGILSRDKVREARCRYWVCQTSRARERLSFTARTSLQDGIRNTLSWYRNAGWLTF